MSAQDAKTPVIQPGLEAGWYFDARHFEKELQRVIRPAWQYGALSRDLREPGDFVATTIHGTPAVIVRDGERLRAFVNACRHRGHSIAKGSGNRGTLQCPYHAWTYRLDGTLRSVPRGRVSEDELAQIRLPQLAVESFGDWVFVCLDDDPEPLLAWLGGFPEFAAEQGISVDGLVFRERLSIDVTSNWKVLFENNVECYHCPSIHPQTFSKLVKTMPDQFKIRTAGNCIAELTEVADEHRRGDLERAGTAEAQFYLLFPTTSLSRDDYIGTAFTLHPLSPTRTRMVVDMFVDPAVEEGELEQWVRMYDRTFEEDRAAMENVQSALSASLLEQTRALPTDEPGVAHFHGLLRAALAAGGAG